MSGARIKLVHVINSFEPGGAESMLCNLLLRADRSRFDVSVVALIDDMTVAGPLIEAGIPIAKMGIRPGMPEPTGVLRLMSYLRRARPAVVQTWMDHSNLIGGVASRVVCGAKVVWGVHHSDHVKALTKRTTLLTVGACARFSRWVPEWIVLCSEHSRKLYGERGFAAEKMQVIPNGFDTTRFRPDAAARVEVRKELGIRPDAPVVGLVARYDPFKDHAGFCRAAALVAKARPDARFVMCGRGVDGGNRALVSLIGALGIEGRCHLLGPRNDVPRVLAALDVLASSSVSEAFPLAVGEAMACGVPCVATDVGDSALMLGPAGRMVPAGDTLALAEGLNEVLGMDVAERARLGNEGGAVGPDLTAISSRFKSRDILESIVDPSKVVSEQFQNTILDLKDGDTVDGRILEETADSVIIQPNPLQPEKLTVKKSDIKDRRPSKLSPMPQGLANILRKNEILDLLAYLESAGRKDAPMFAK